MKRLFYLPLVLVLAAGIAASGCGTAPAATEAFPAKGKPLTMIVPVAAGGATDASTRMVAEAMEKDLGTTIQIVNKPGANGQTGFTELTQAKPDGYTMAASPLAGIIVSYLDPDRKAAYGAKNIQPVANHMFPPVVFSVKADSPYKTLKELVDASKAKPGTLRMASTGIMSNNHLTILQMEKLSGSKFSLVQFEGGSAAMTALLGGHVDVSANVLPEVISHNKSGAIRPLGITDKQETKLLAGVPTLESQGYKVYAYGSCGIAVPGGTPKAIVDILSKSIKKAVDDKAFLDKMEGMGYPIQYMDADQYSKFWSDLEAETAPLIALAKAS